MLLGVETLPDDPTRRLDRQVCYLATEILDGPFALLLDLRPASGHNRLRLLFGFVLQFSAQLFTLFGVPVEKRLTLPPRLLHAELVFLSGGLPLPLRGFSRGKPFLYPFLVCL